MEKYAIEYVKYVNIMYYYIYSIFIFSGQHHVDNKVIYNWT